MYADVHHMGVQILADSHEWAYGWAMRHLKALYPTSDGWTLDVAIDAVAIERVREWSEAMGVEPAAVGE
jgi:hypothetical protein